MESVAEDTAQHRPAQPAPARPGTEQPAPARPGTEQPAPARPGAEKPAPARPGTQQPPPAKSGTDQPGTQQPGLTRPGPAQSGPAQSGPAPSFYAAVGGEETFGRLVSRFYAEVEADPALRAVYPSRDLGPAREHLRLFLIQYWGGPATYNELRGHPRLRMRHAHFVIGEAERDAWLRHMRTAMDELALDPEHDEQLWDYLVMAAQSLVNSPDDRPLSPLSDGGRPDLGLRPTRSRPGLGRTLAETSARRGPATAQTRRGRGADPAQTPAPSGTVLHEHAVLQSR